MVHETSSPVNICTVLLILKCCFFAGFWTETLCGEMKTIAKKMRKRTSIKKLCVSFFQHLVEADIKRNGSVTRPALHKIITTNGLHLSAHQMNQVWNMFPLNQDGTIQYKDFLSLYANTVNTPRRNSSKPSTARSPQKVAKWVFNAINIWTAYSSAYFFVNIVF